MSEQKGFLPIEDLKAAQKTIRDAAKAGTPATAWTKGQRFNALTRIVHFDINQNSLAIEVNELKDLELLEAELAVSPYVFLTYSAQQQGIFFRAKFRGRGASSHVIELDLPTTVYRAQKRKFPRAVVQHRDDVHITYPDPQNPGRVLRRKLYDISVGGGSIVLFFGEERHHHVRQQLEAITLQIGPYSIKTWGIVKHLQAFPPDYRIQGMQLGLEFFNFGPNDKKIINQLVEKELMNQFSTVDAD